MEFKNLIFLAWKGMELNCRSMEVMENYQILFGSLVTADDKARTM